MRKRKPASINVVIPNEKGIEVVTGIWCEPWWRRLVHWVFRIRSVALGRVPTWREVRTRIVHPTPLKLHPMAGQVARQRLMAMFEEKE